MAQKKGSLGVSIEPCYSPAARADTFERVQSRVLFFKVKAMSEENKLHFPATHRNRSPILAQLQRWLPQEGTVLEVASGSGQHGVYFAEHLTHLFWQPSDCEVRYRESVEAWRLESGLENLLPVLTLDVLEHPWPLKSAEALYCANMLHISPWETCEGLFRGASQVLSKGAPLILYGPFCVKGVPTAESNQHFDASLKARHVAWGLRWLHDVIELARSCNFAEPQIQQMPANNLMLMFRRL